jgi:DNA-binding NtrC family response regulator
VKVLVVDDERGIRDLVKYRLTEEGYDVVVAESGERALELGREQVFDLILCDVRMGTVGGFDVLRAFKEELAPDADIVLMTGYALFDTAVKAIRQGAFDCVLKPFDLDVLARLARATAARLAHAQPSEPPAPASLDMPHVIGASPAMFEVFKTIGRVASTNLPVLIIGESGTGKEVIARALHSNSPRASHPFVAVNCGALTETLLETELFGHVRGSFTGAANDRRGFFEEASGGTLLLDEITETSPAFQVKLLRVLQEGEVCRVGSNQSIKVNTRVVATTNRDPEALASAGLMRSDLLYRLNVVSIHLPPLRDRGDDIDEMIAVFLRRYRAPDAPCVQLTPNALERLRSYQWPGNVRELRHTMQRLAVLFAGKVVDADDLPEKIRQSQALLDGVLADSTASHPRLESQPGADHDLVPLDELERRYLIRVLYATEGNIKRAAEILRVDRKTLARMVDRFGVKVGRIREDTKRLTKEA